MVRTVSTAALTSLPMTAKREFESERLPDALVRSAGEQLLRIRPGRFASGHCRKRGHAADLSDHCCARLRSSGNCVPRLKTRLVSSERRDEELRQDKLNTLSARSRLRSDDAALGYRVTDIDRRASGNYPRTSR